MGPTSITNTYDSLATTTKDHRFGKTVSPDVGLTAALVQQRLNGKFRGKGMKKLRKIQQGLDPDRAE
jgi:hypothetical protein